METAIKFMFAEGANFWWGLSAFIVFVVILLKVALKPVVSAIDARDAKIKQQLDEAESTYTKAKQLQDDLKKQLDAAEAKVSALLAEARRDGEALKTELVAAGRAEVDDLRNKSLREIAAARHEALVELRREVAELSTLAAERIIKANVTTERHADLIDQALAEIVALEQSVESGAKKA